MTDYEVSPLTSVQPAVSIKELADWLRLDDSGDPILMSIVESATQLAIKYIGYDLLNRDWVLTHYTWPEKRHGTYGLSGRSAIYETCVNLPYANKASTVVSSVIAVGEALVDGDDFYLKGNDIVFDNAHLAFDSTPALVVNYTAGYGTTCESIPREVILGVKQIGSYLFSKRGACSGAEALKESGAAESMLSVRNPALII